jgi:hypothetical protein
MRAYVLGGVIVAAMLLAGTSMKAHHSFAAEFDGTKQIRLTGVVTKIEWTNPHVWFYVNVKSTERSNDGGKTWTLADAGQVTNWGAEMGPPHGLQRSGWRRDTLKIGEQVTVQGSLAKNGSKRINARNVVLASTGGRPGQKLDAASSEGGNNQ